MNMNMKRFYVGTALAAALFAAAPAAAAEVRLCSGVAGGGYDGIVQGVAAELQRQGHAVQVTNYDGSEAILNALTAGKCDFGPAQADVHFLMSLESPAVGSKAAPATLLYNEAMTLVCTKKSGYDELDDIDSSDTIIVGPIGSGGAKTWEAMVKIEKEYGGENAWSKANVVYLPLDEAGAAMSVGQGKCTFGVGSVPIAWATDLVERGGVISEVYDKDLNDMEYNDGSLYEEAYVGKGAYGTKYYTYKIPAIMFRNAAYNDKAISKIVMKVAESLGRKKNTIE